MSKFKYELGMNPEPTDSHNSREVTELVVADLELRTEKGVQRYKRRLKTNNGRNALVDLYEELLDGAQYVRQALEESADTTLVPRAYMDKVSKQQVLITDLLGTVAFDEESEFLQITNRAGFIRYLKALKELNNGQ